MFDTETIEDARDGGVQHDQELEGPPEPALSPAPRVHYQASAGMTLCGRERQADDENADGELCGACSVLAIPMVGTMRAAPKRRRMRAPCTL